MVKGSQLQKIVHISNLGLFAYLNLHLCNKGAMQSIANVIGNLIGLDTDIFDLVWSGYPRMLVEIDLSKSLPDVLWINNGDKQIFK
jgi:hypothetical protein